MDIRITKTKADEILRMFTDWEETFSKENKEYKLGYIAATRDFLNIIQLNKDDLISIKKNF